MVHHPISIKSRLGWEILRLICKFDLFRVLPGGAGPPQRVVDALAPYTLPSGSFAVARGNHEHRYIALALSQDGIPRCILKLAFDSAGEIALARESSMIATMGDLLTPPLRAPHVVEAGEGVMVTDCVLWRPQLRPWRMSPEVAKALGQFFWAGRPDGELKGNAHGDCAPWNILRTKDDGYVLIDWEAASGEGAPFHDLFHFIFQGHSLLGKPTLRAIRRGIRGKGWIGAAITAYAEGAQFASTESGPWLTEYLQTSLESRIAPASLSESKAGRILEMLGPIGRGSGGQAIDERSSGGGYRDSHVPAVNASYYESGVYAPGSFDSWVWEREQFFLRDALERSHLDEKSNYLDFACGTGRILVSLEESFKVAKGVDISKAMLEVASRKVKRAEIVQGDITADPSLLRGPFDLITAFRFFLNAEDSLRDDALSAITQRLKTNGTFILNLHGNTFSLRGLSITFRKLVLQQKVNQLSYWQLKRKLNEHGLNVVEVRGLGMLPPRLWTRSPDRVRSAAESLGDRTGLHKRFATNLVLVCRRSS